MIPRRRRGWIRVSIGLFLLTALLASHAWRLGRARAGDDPPPQGRREAPIRERLARHRAEARKLMEEMMPKIEERDRLQEEQVNQEITAKRAEADAANAIKTAEVAEIAVREYLEGTFPQEMSNAEGELTLAKSELTRAQDRMKWSEEMQKRGVVSSTEYLADVQAHLKSQIALNVAQDKINVLTKYTKPREETRLRANIEKAKADALAKQATLNLEKAKKDRMAKAIQAPAFGPEEGRAVTLLDESLDFADRSRAALSADPPKLEQADRLSSRALATIVESAKAWQQVKDMAAAEREASMQRAIHSAADDLRKAKAPRP